MSNRLIFALEHTVVGEDGILYESWPNGIYNNELHFKHILDGYKKLNINNILDPIIFHCFHIQNTEDLKKNIFSGKAFTSLIGYQEGCFNSTYVNNGLAEYKNLKEITTDERYIFPIEIYTPDFLRIPIFLDRGLSLPNKVINDAKRGTCKILLHQLGEGQGHNITILKNFIERQSKIFDIPISSFGFLDENAKTPELQKSYGSRGFCLFKWYDMSQQPTNEYVKNKVIDSINPSKKSDYFICLNRVVREHRAIIATNIFRRWSDKSIWSFDVPLLTTGEYAGLFDEDFLKILPKTLDIDLSYNDLQINYELLNNAHINLITETFFYNNDTIFFSEKIFKPILAIQPFIVIGNSLSLRELRKLGFKTFHPFINEEYDEMVDDDKRMEAILSEIDRLYNLRSDEMLSLVKNVMGICLHNYNFLISLRKTKMLERKLCKELLEWVSE